jgi:hypothetical protein
LVQKATNLSALALSVKCQEATNAAQQFTALFDHHNPFMHRTYAKIERHWQELAERQALAERSEREEATTVNPVQSASANRSDG